MTKSPAETIIPPRPRPRRRLVRTTIVFLMLGLLLNIATTLALSVWVDPFAGESTSLAAAIGVDDRWSVTRFERTGATGVISEHSAAVSWSYRQACGPPNTPAAGDQITAWAPSSTDAAIEWLELDFAAAVVPASVQVVATYNPGGLFKVEVYGEDGSKVTAWEGVDPTPVGSGMGTSDVPLKIDFPTRKVRIWIDSPKVPGWNEIDAVGLVDKSGNVQWAVKAKASTYYGQSSYAAMPTPPGAPAEPSPASLLPSFGGMETAAMAAVESGDADLETRATAGFGWPMRSLWTPVKAVPPGVASPVVTSFALLSAPPPGPPTTAGRTQLPYRPVWPGFAVNTVLYAMVLFVLYWLAVKPRRFITEVGRIRRGACLECGYDLGYDFIKGCPECGWRRDRAEQDFSA